MLPAPLTALVGREADLAELTAALVHDTARLITLTGLAGAGKTRLAVAAAETVRAQFAGGVCFFDLTGFSSADDLPALLSLAGHQATGDCTCPRSRGRTLLLLDNAEQVSGMGARVAETLAAAPFLSILVTSRRPLGVNGERVLALSGLKVEEHTPSGTQSGAMPAMPGPAVQLFIERARAARRDFTLSDAGLAKIRELCSRLGGLPLAIELVAARTRVLGVAALLARADHVLDLPTGGRADRPPRHRSLRAALDWSHDLLTPEQRRLLRGLAVFAGGCTVETAAAVLGVAEGPLFESLSELVEHGLVTAAEQADGEPRFLLPEPVRTYAREQLVAAGDLSVTERRFAEVFLALVERAAPGSRSEQDSWFNWLDQEHTNLSAVLAWAGTEGEIDTGLRLTRALGWFWYRRGYLRESRRWLDGLLERAGADGPTRAAALAEAGVLGWYQGDYAAARLRLEESISLQRQYDDPRGLAQALTYLGMVALQQGEYSLSRDSHEEATALRRRLGDMGAVAWSLTSLAGVAHDQGDFAAAREYEEESLRLFRQLGDDQGVSLPLYGLGRLAYRQGDFAAARLRFEESLAACRAQGETWMAAQALNSLGETARAAGDLPLARNRYSEALAYFREMGVDGWSAMALHNLGHVALRMSEVRQAYDLFAESLTIGRRLGERRNLLLILAGMAGVAVADGRAELAGQLFGAVEMVREGTGMRIDGADLAEYERTMHLISERLEGAALVEAMASGRSLSVSGAYALALSAEPLSNPDLAAAAVAADVEPEPAPAHGLPGLRSSLLTQRQREVAILIARGLTNRQIAHQLTITEGTVGTHVEHILDKLGCQSRAQVAAWVVGHGLDAAG